MRAGCCRRHSADDGWAAAGDPFSFRGSCRLWARSQLDKASRWESCGPRNEKAREARTCGLVSASGFGAYPCANRDRSMPLLTNGGNMPQNNHACKIYLFFSVNSSNMRLSQRSAPRSVYALCCSCVRRTRIMIVGGAGGRPAPSRFPPLMLPWRAVRGTPRPRTSCMRLRRTGGQKPR